MKVFASWSGGKDCMLAVHRQLKVKDIEVVCLVNMCDSDGEHSRSHGIKKELIAKQAQEMSIPIVQKAIDNRGYEECFKSVIADQKRQGIEGGIFGDIYLMEHRTWIERVCAEMDIVPIFPLWENNTRLLLKEFIDAGFKTLTVAVNTNMLDRSWLGKVLDTSFYDEITGMNDIDPCAENGEYHSFVFDGPLFKKPVAYVNEGIIHKENHTFLKLKLV